MRSKIILTFFIGVTWVSEVLADPEIGRSFTHLNAQEELVEVMEINVDRVLAIFLDLLYDEHYDQLIENGGAIRDHGIQLKSLNPEKSDLQRHNLFQAYAIQLEMNAEQLMHVAEQIDQKRGKAEDVKSLKSNAAYHFGQVLSTCFSCHSEFRKPHRPQTK